VSASAGDAAAAGCLGALFTGPFRLAWKLLLLEAWLTAELVLLLASAALCVTAVVKGEASAREVTMSRVRWGLWMVNLKGEKR
jgi:hypothetical protein